MSDSKIKILVADDTVINITIIKKFLEPRGFEVIAAHDGVEAVTKFVETNPDIILMDIMMPNMDGYEATKKIKKLSLNKWVPLLFLSAKADFDDQVYGLELGGDDYLTKPINFNVLKAKLNAMLRIVEMQRQLDLASKKIKMFADKYTDELILTQELMQRMGTRKESLESDKIQLFSDPADEISGDIVLTYQSENSSKQYFILADATGHGLTAAISLIPLSQHFYRLSSENYCLSDLVSALNTRLFTILPRDRFVAATLGVIDTEKQTIEIWNGANPVPHVVNGKGKLLHSFETDNFCLGVVSGDIFSADSVTIRYDESCELLAYSDGIIDTRDCQGNDFTSKGILNSLTSQTDNEQSVFDQLVDDLNQFRDHENKVDDICILSIKCN